MVDAMVIAVLISLPNIASKSSQSCGLSGKWEIPCHMHSSASFGILYVIWVTSDLKYSSSVRNPSCSIPSGSVCVVMGGRSFPQTPLRVYLEL